MARLVPRRLEARVFTQQTDHFTSLDRQVSRFANDSFSGYLRIAVSVTPRLTDQCDHWAGELIMRYASLSQLHGSRRDWGILRQVNSIRYGIWPNLEGS